MESIATRRGRPCMTEIHYYKRGDVVARQSPIHGPYGNGGRTVLVEFSDGSDSRRMSCGWFAARPLGSSTPPEWTEVDASTWMSATNGDHP